MDRLLGTLGAVFGALGVAAGAFGAHALKDAIPADRLDVFRTGVTYELVHALALLSVGSWSARTPRPALRRAGLLFAAGIVLFSGSLYAFALSGVKAFGLVTPFGGLAFVAGWAVLAFAAARPRAP